MMKFKKINFLKKKNKPYMHTRENRGNEREDRKEDCVVRAKLDLLHEHILP